MGRQVLISPQEFQSRLCAAPEGARYWVWGTRSDAGAYRALAGLEPVANSVKYVIWQVVSDAAFKQRVCGGTPTAGS